ncbi:hypothetical protein B7G54_02400 [Burkholderia puraquae]|uniref:Uncharacterized protein n=1 Tax=Burkholderia puraquae TaxID=1904757 RepID=A0A1X1PP79_9BURK|nr:hypothetical protein B7G54_02400 [Burkholderia puraquae]
MFRCSSPILGAIGLRTRSVRACSPIRRCSSVSAWNVLLTACALAMKPSPEAGSTTTHSGS